ncbi:LOW QUALITY PROTEIN: ciliogenesis-associated TTC17-interacting protein [Mycteria americana]|uniref:LOW QUALITY PROTEIN: ciliogenesis-associated TTC17-interacting protein n=1 Tax=Mycteria americana TaxID=33587 RepID=UPI003F584534
MDPPRECRQETPALTEAAAEFLSLIGPEELERCLFAETLEMVAAGGQPGDRARGQWWVTARWAPYEQAGEPVRSCVLVQAGSRGRQDGVPCSSTLKAYVTPQLETLEQEEQERLEVTWVAVACPLAPVLPPALGCALQRCPPGGCALCKLRPHPIERRTHMLSHQHGMTVTKTLREGEAEQRCWSFSYGWAELRGLLLEGASLLLLRVLACRQAVPPGLIFLAIDTEGHLCTSSYRALGIQQQAVGLVEAEVFVIERAMLTGAGVSTIWQSSFLPSGRLAQRVQVGCPMLVVLQDESILTKTGGVEPQPSFPKEPLDWEEDIQLFSWFLDRKEELQASHAAYVQQHPELRALLADFLQALLLRQPHDPTSFAAQFFAPFACQRPPGTPFASAGAASPLPSTLPHHPPADGE